MMKHPKDFFLHQQIPNFFLVERNWKLINAKQKLPRDILQRKKMKLWESTRNYVLKVIHTQGDQVSIVLQHHVSI